MYLKRLTILSIVVFMVIVLSSCSTKGVPGIEVPIVVKRVDLIFDSVSKVNSLITGLEVKAGGNIVASSILPESPYDTWIVIEASTKYSGNKDACDWVQDRTVKLEQIRNGQKIELNCFSCASDYSEGYVRFYFAGYKTGSSEYVLILPSGKEVPLVGLIQ